MLTPLLSLPVIPELARDLCAQMGYERIGEIPDQEEFKRKVLENQIAEEEKLGSFLSDRSTIDCWVLWLRWNFNQAMTYDTEAFYEKARQQAEKYTHIVFIPPMFPPLEDGFRWTDIDYQKQVHRLTKMTLFDWELMDRTFIVSQSGNQERVDEVMQWLKSGQ